MFSGREVRRLVDFYNYFSAGNIVPVQDHIAYLKSVYAKYADQPDERQELELKRSMEEINNRVLFLDIPESAKITVYDLEDWDSCVPLFEDDDDFLDQLTWTPVKWVCDACFDILVPHYDVISHWDCLSDQCTMTHAVVGFVGAWDTEDTVSLFCRTMVSDKNGNSTNFYFMCTPQDDPKYMRFLDFDNAEYLDLCVA